MSDRFLTVDECLQLGVEPYAIYGAKVHSFRRVPESGFGFVTVPHGSAEYRAMVDKLSAKEPCGQTPTHVHCHGCGRERVILWMPCSFDQLTSAIAKAAENGCPDCGSKDQRLGPSCSVAVRKAR